MYHDSYCHQVVFLKSFPVLRSPGVAFRRSLTYLHGFAASMAVACLSLEGNGDVERFRALEAMKLCKKRRGSHGTSLVYIPTNLWWNFWDWYTA